MHKPFYKDLASGEYKLPWTRMHALKDYYGMVRILEEFPHIRQTFNLVPSMMAQVEEYASGAAHDPYLEAVLKPAESSIHTDKSRAILKRLSPVPVFSGKATLEIGGAHSLNVFTNPEQEFYLQLSEMERFGIAQLTTKGAVRIVEKVTTLPVVNEIVEEPTMVEILKLELDSGLYKIWPKEKLPPGEYAVVQYTENKLNIQVWDFAIKAK